ncbi:MAG: hypothetical protein E8A12_19170 [Phenylobacterium sp.]|nr:MAG: hypothetical protein E8A12_19170 [Phenylobacterium sp.]
MDYSSASQVSGTRGSNAAHSQATAVGLLQLCAQLVRVGVLDEHAVTVIKDAIAKDIVLTRPRSASRDDYERSIRERLDSLFSGQEAVGTGQSD